MSGSERPHLEVIRHIGENLRVALETLLQIDPSGALELVASLNMAWWMLLAWQIQRGISTLAKSINPARLRENFAANAVQLTKGDLDRIASLDQGFRFIAGAFWAIPGSQWNLETIWDEPSRASA